MSKDEMETIKKNDAVCIIRLICNNANIACLFDFIRDIYEPLRKPKYNNKSANLIVKYFTNNGNDRSLKTIYIENKESTYHLQSNKSFFSPINKDDFVKCELDNRVLVFEIQYDTTESDKRNYETISDPINFQYLLLIMDYLENKNIRYGVFVSGKKGQSIYTPLDHKTYFQLRTFLYFSTDKQNNNMRFSVQSNDSNNWVRLFADTEKERTFDNNFGRIMPLVPINQVTYELIQKNVDVISDEDKYSYYKKLIKCYKARICKKSVLTEYDLQQYCKYDNYIEELIFLSTLNYILEDSEDFKLYQIDCLHETCVDYAQGVFQLIENACFHAISKRENGCGNFAIRIRKSIEMRSFIQSSLKKEISYFMEIYVTDLSFTANGFKGIVNKLYENIETRVKTCKDPSEEKMLRDVLSTKDTDDCIKLSEIFGNSSETNNEYNTYLQHSINVAYHYGLQILNNAINVGDGYLCVRSGEGDSNYYSDSNNGKYYDQKVNWRNGTAYIIYLPLNISEVIDHHDSIAVFNESNEDFEDSEYLTKELPGNMISKLCNISTFFSPQDKEKCVFNLIEDIEFANQSRDIIYWIDCSRIDNKYSYEILAKAVFCV